MKKVINGKMYDTNTAKEMGDWSNGYYSNDFAYTYECLYRKRTGEFFLYGEGGPQSKYAEWHGNSGSGSCNIFPYTFAEAKEWAEKHLDGESYEAIFGRIEEDDSKQLISASITKESYAKLKRASSEKGMTISDLIDGLIKGM